MAHRPGIDLLVLRVEHGLTLAGHPPGKVRLQREHAGFIEGVRLCLVAYLAAVAPHRRAERCGYEVLEDLVHVEHECRGAHRSRLSADRRAPQNQFREAKCRFVSSIEARDRRCLSIPPLSQRLDLVENGAKSLKTSPGLHRNAREQKQELRGCPEHPVLSDVLSEVVVADVDREWKPGGSEDLGSEVNATPYVHPRLLAADAAPD